MSNIPSDINEKNQPVLLAVVFPVHREGTISAAEEEALSSVEEIITRNPNAKHDI